MVEDDATLQHAEVSESCSERHVSLSPYTSECTTDATRSAKLASSAEATERGVTLMETTACLFVFLDVMGDAALKSGLPTRSPSLPIKCVLCSSLTVAIDDVSDRPQAFSALRKPAL